MVSSSTDELMRMVEGATCIFTAVDEGSSGAVETQTGGRRQRIAMVDRRASCQ